MLAIFTVACYSNNKLAHLAVSSVRAKCRTRCWPTDNQSKQLCHRHRKHTRLNESLSFQAPHVNTHICCHPSLRAAITPEAQIRTAADTSWRCYEAARAHPKVQARVRAQTEAARTSAVVWGILKFNPVLTPNIIHTKIRYSMQDVKCSKI